MNYIQQAYKGDIGFWKYIIIPLFFFGFMGLNIIAMQFIDIEAVMKSEIAKKGSNQVLLEMLLPFLFFLAILFIWVKFVHKQSLTSLTTSRSSIDWKRVFFSFGVWAGFTAIMIFSYYYFQPETLEYNFKPKKFLGLVLISLLLIPIQTSFEEYFFRGYLLQGIGAKFKSRWLPLILTSVVFGLVHIGNPEVQKLGMLIMVYYIGTGLFLGIITLMDEGLELALGFHAANNLATALLVTADWTAFQTNSVFKDVSVPSLGIDVFLPVLVYYPFLLFVFSKKYGWTNWKEKLFGKVEKPLEIEQNQLS